MRRPEGLQYDVRPEGLHYDVRPEGLHYDARPEGLHYDGPARCHINRAVHASYRRPWCCSPSRSPACTVAHRTPPFRRATLPPRATSSTSTASPATTAG